VYRGIACSSKTLDSASLNQAQAQVGMSGYGYGYGSSAPPPPPPPPPRPPNNIPYGQQQQHYGHPNTNDQYYYGQQQQQQQQQYANQQYSSPAQQQQQQYYAQPQATQQQYAPMASQGYYGAVTSHGAASPYSQQPPAAASYGGTQTAAVTYGSQYASPPPPPPPPPPAPVAHLGAQQSWAPLATPPAAPSSMEHHVPTQQTQNSPPANTFQYSYVASALPDMYPSSSNEPYGEVISTTTTNTLTHRSEAKRHVQPPTFSSYGSDGVSSSSYGGHATTSSYGGGTAGSTTAGAMNFFKNNALEYKHNRVSLVFLVPPLVLLFWSFESPYPLQTLIFLTLALYGMDMANARELLAVFLWVCAAILTMVTGWFLLLETPDDADTGLATLSIIVRTTGHCFLFLSLVRCSSDYIIQYDQLAFPRRTMMLTHFLQRLNRRLGAPCNFNGFTRMHQHGRSPWNAWFMPCCLSLRRRLLHLNSRYH
jgi:hypothetical protein